MDNNNLHIISGPGSQPGESDGAELDYMQMPSEMSTFAVPLIPEADEAVGLDAGKALLERLLVYLQYYPNTDGKPLELGWLDEANRQLVNQVLGEGEVSIICEDRLGVRIQESVLAGVWRLNYLDEHGKVIRDVIEVAEIPSWVKQQTFSSANERVDVSVDALPEGVMNAPPLLAEINDHIDQVQPGGEPHIINLTLLPQTEQDLAFLNQQLGQGRVAVLSRGYGNCRISSTNIRNVWWVQYFNSQDRIILNSIEVTDVPIVACAAREDIQESAQRLAEIMEVYR